MDWLMDRAATLEHVILNILSKSKTEKVFFLKQKASSLSCFGDIYSDQGDIIKTLDYYHKSLKIREEIDDKSGVAASLINIGIIYQNHGDIAKTLEYWHRSLKIQEEIGDKIGTATSLNNIGVIYQNQGDIPKSLEFYQKSLKRLLKCMN